MLSEDRLLLLHVFCRGRKSTQVRELCDGLEVVVAGFLLVIASFGSLLKGRRRLPKFHLPLTPRVRSTSPWGLIGINRKVGEIDVFVTIGLMQKIHPADKGEEDGSS
jgi:hypothetical protein